MKQKKMSLALKTFIGFGLGIVIGLIFQEKARDPIKFRVNDRL